MQCFLTIVITVLPLLKRQEDEEADFSDDTQYPFSQNELNDLVRDLNLSKSSAELLHPD